MLGCVVVIIDVGRRSIAADGTGGAALGGVGLGASGCVGSHGCDDFLRFEILSFELDVGRRAVFGSQRGRNGALSPSISSYFESERERCFSLYHSSVKLVGLVRSKGAWCHHKY
eukprot:scaffold37470_cov144-Skeletonema_dohrnii-CCMP3373.AAC.2